MFKENVEFRVTINDFRDRCEPQVLRQAGSQFLRAVREASAEYLEDCRSLDAELRWTVTLHPKYGVGTIHYVVSREDIGCEGKCLVWDLEKGPVQNRPWTPIGARRGELINAIDINEFPKGVGQPIAQNFNLFYFKGWIPAARVSADMIEEDTERVLIGVGFSNDLVLGQGDYLLSLPKQLQRMRGAHQIVMESGEFPREDALAYKAGRTFEFDLRPTTGTITMRAKYLKINEKEQSQEELFELVVQEGGWINGSFVLDKETVQHVDILSWLQHRNY
jgi:hypothetical protein